MEWSWLVLGGGLLEEEIKGKTGPSELEDERQKQADWP